MSRRAPVGGWPAPRTVNAGAMKAVRSPQPRDLQAVGPAASSQPLLGWGSERRGRVCGTLGCVPQAPSMSTATSVRRFIDCVYVQYAAQAYLKLIQISMNAVGPKGSVYELDVFRVKP